MGFPKSDLSLALSVPTMMVMVSLLAVACLRRTFFRMALQNMGRRKLQALLIILGLSVGAVLVAGALTLGDTLNKTLFKQAAGHFGHIDLTVEMKGVTGRRPLFDLTQATQIGDAMRSRVPELYLSPALYERAVLQNPDGTQTLPGVHVLGLSPDVPSGYGPLVDLRGEGLAISGLKAGEVLLTSKAASALGIAQGDMALVPVAGETKRLQVKSVIRQSGVPFAEATMLLPLEHAQDIWDLPAQVNLVLGGLPSVTDSERAKVAVEAVREIRSYLADARQVDHVFLTLKEEPVRQRIRRLSGELPQSSPLAIRIHELDQALDEVVVTPAFRSSISDRRVSDLINDLDLDANHGVVLRESLRSLTDFQVTEVRADALNSVAQASGTASTIFLVFGLFSLVTSLVLLFLLFMLLAEDRRKENGILRAVGLKRGQVALIYFLEGIMYAVPAALLGQVFGWWLGQGAVSFSASVFFEGPLQETAPEFTLDVRSLIIAFCITFLVSCTGIAVSAWRVSQLSIVEAIRGLPDVVRQRLHRGFLPALGAMVFGILPLLGGIVLVALGRSGRDAVIMMAGASLCLAGAYPLYRLLLSCTPLTNQSAPETAATVASASVLVLWSLPLHKSDPLGISSFRMGVDLFFLGGIVIVPVVLVLILFNIRWLSSLSALAPLGRLAAFLRLAIAFPMTRRLRTGMAMGIIALVMMTVVLISGLYQSSNQVYKNRDHIWGGFNTTVFGSIEELASYLRTEGLEEQIDVVAPMWFGAVQARQVRDGESDSAWVTFPLQAGDEQFFQVVASHFPLKLRSPQYSTDRDVWLALQSGERVAVLTYDVAQLRRDFNIGRVPNDLQFSGFYLEDDLLPQTVVQIRTKDQLAPVSLRVIGIASPSTLTPALYISDTMLAEIGLGETKANGAYLRLKPGASPIQFVAEANRLLTKHSLEVTGLEQVLEHTLRNQDSFNVLLQAFISLGLLVGVVALGVLQLQAVMERRQQIGILRALGYNKRFIYCVFLAENLSLTMVGLGVGGALGIYLTFHLVEAYRLAFPGMAFVTPWSTLALVSLVSCLSALGVSMVAASRAASIVPADALRYE